MDKAWLTMTITERKMPNTAAAQDFWVSCPGEDNGGKMSNGTQKPRPPWFCGVMHQILNCITLSVCTYQSPCPRDQEPRYSSSGH